VRVLPFFMKTLKQEEVDGRAYRDADDARGSIGSFIEEVYNRQRLHSALTYLSPTEFEATLRPEVFAATPRHGGELQPAGTPSAVVATALGAPA
jgi:hypothetical protein